MLVNNTFSLGVNGEFNATVGNNGSGMPEGEARSNIFYAIGFSSAALELIKVALSSQEIENCVDYLVYPICFSMRHAVELQLKKLWKDLAELSKYRNTKLVDYRNKKEGENPELKGTLKPFPDLDESSTHDLKNIWNLIKEYAPLIDVRFIKFIELLSPFINDISEIDSTGQTFRYPESNESKMHLAETSIISIEVLKVRFTNLVEILKSLEYSCEEMKYEYNWAMVTNHLSHFDIIEATNQIATFMNSDTIYYKAAKEFITEKFNISNREYNFLIKISTKNKMINHTLEIENEPEHLNLKSLIIFFDLLDGACPMVEYVDSYENEKALTFDDDSFFHEKTITKIISNMDAIKKVSEELTLNQIAEIYALYDCCRQPCYIEIFNRNLKENIEELEIYKSKNDKNEIYSFVGHFFRKSNLIEYVFSSLWRLNMKTLVETLGERYSLGSIPWYKDLKSGYIRNGVSAYELFNREVTRLHCITKESNKIINELSHIEFE